MAIPKEHGFKGHVESFVTQVKRNCTPLVKKPFKKRDIYVVSYGMNTGSEVNGDRPSIIYKDSKNTQGQDLMVIPLTSAQLEKQSDAFDVFVAKEETNLYQNSWARLRQLRPVSLKRLGKYVGSISDEKVITTINARVKEML